MNPLRLSLAAVGLLAATTAFAAPRQVVYGYPPPPHGLTADEVRDFREEQMERHQAMQRAALRMQQKVERRAWGVDDDD